MFADLSCTSCCQLKDCSPLSTGIIHFDTLWLLADKGSNTLLRLCIPIQALKQNHKISPKMWKKNGFIFIFINTYPRLLYDWDNVNTVNYFVTVLTLQNACQLLRIQSNNRTEQKCRLSLRTNIHLFWRTWHFQA